MSINGNNRQENNHTQLSGWNQKELYWESQKQITKHLHERRGHGHKHERPGQGPFPTMLVPHVADDQASQRSHEKGGAKNGKTLEERIFVVVGKEIVRNLGTKETKQGKVVPFQNIAHDAGGRLKRRSGHGCGCFLDLSGLVGWVGLD